METTSVIAPKKTLFFIPDISGFTQFISDRDFQHQQHIIAELLEVLIETNPLNLKVNEVEGDAILFYLSGEPPPLKDLVDQSEQMYLAFHSHLKKYGVSRLCICPTCQSASRLTLKFVAHHGEGAFHKVKDREKIFGTDVIMAHRLLKNSIPEREYLLVTDSIKSNNGSSLSEESNWKRGNETYDSGEVSFHYFPLSSWYDKVPEPTIQDPQVYKVKRPLIHTVRIDAPIETIYESLIDLGQRKHYMVGMEGLTVKDRDHNRLNRICTTFECSMEHEKCTFETSHVELSANRMTFSETLQEQPITFDYELQRDDDHTLLSLSIHPALKFPMKWLFDLKMKRKMNSDSKQMLNKLKSYCEAKDKRQGAGSMGHGEI